MKFKKFLYNCIDTNPILRGIGSSDDVLSFHKLLYIYEDICSSILSCRLQGVRGIVIPNIESISVSVKNVPDFSTEEYKEYINTKLQKLYNYNMCNI